MECFHRLRVEEAPLKKNLHYTEMCGYTLRMDAENLCVQGFLALGWVRCQNPC